MICSSHPMAKGPAECSAGLPNGTCWRIEAGACVDGLGWNRRHDRRACMGRREPESCALLQEERSGKLTCAKHLFEPKTKPEWGRLAEQGVVATSIDRSYGMIAPRSLRQVARGSGWFWVTNRNTM